MNGFVSAFEELNQALAAEGDFLLNLPLALIYEDPANLRGAFDEAEMAALTATVREKGVLQPIVVRPADVDGRYRIRFGARRYRAAACAGLTTTAALVRAGPESAADTLIEQVIENDQHAPLNTAQLARAVAALLDEGLTQAAVGVRLGRPKDRIAMLAAVRTMPAFLQALAPALGLRTLYELFNAWKADPGRVEAWLSGRDPADITQAQARALGDSDRADRRAPKAASSRLASRSASTLKSSRELPIVEVSVDGQIGRLVLELCPTEGHALVRFDTAASAQAVPLPQIRLTGLRTA